MVEQPRSVGEVVGALFSRGDLPESVCVRLAPAGPVRLPVGSVWSWDDFARGYLSTTSAGVVEPWLVRRGLGVCFVPSPIREQLCLSL